MPGTSMFSVRSFVIAGVGISISDFDFWLFICVAYMLVGTFMYSAVCDVTPMSFINKEIIN